MQFNAITNIETCFNAVRDYVPLTLVYYSHIPTAIISFLMGVFVLVKGKKSLASKLLFLLNSTFALWLVFSLITWTSYNSIVYMFVWSFFGVLTVLVAIFCYYFVYVYVNKKDIPFSTKIIFSFALLPIAYLGGTKFNLAIFNQVDCVPIEGKMFNNIYYLISFIISLWLLIHLIIRYRKEGNHNAKKQIIYLGVGAGLFLILFLSFDYVATVFVDYNIHFYGLFGMTIFLGFLGYLIVRYKAFNIKLIATQALVVALIALIGSEFFFVQNTTSKILVGATLAMSVIFGYMLVRSVKLEVQRKEELQKLSDELAVANEKLRVLDKAKSEFISIASHQLRTPLTSIKGFGSLLLEGTYGEVPEAQRNALEKIYISNERLIQLVEDMLNISRIEAGRMEFDFQEAQIEDLVDEAVKTLELSAKAKSLYLHWEKPETPLPKVKIDITKIKEVISNMVDNAIKYTQKGGVTAKVEPYTEWSTDHKEYHKSVRVVVSDTGIGMDHEEIDMIFEKFQRGKQVSHYHTDGTGLGMYIGKKIVAEHKGRIFAESDGKGKGSRFILELPVT